MRILRAGEVVRQAAGGLLAAAMWCGGTSGWGQSPQPAPDQSARVLATLSEQMTSLQSQISELREQIVASRRESQALREELRQMHSRDLLTQLPVSLRGSLLRPAALQESIPPAIAPAGDAPAETTSQRLARIEEEQAFTASQVATLHQDRVQSGSKYRVRLAGIALLNTFATRGNLENLDVPETAQSREPGSGNSAFGATMRQSIIGLDMTGPTVAGGKTSAEIQFDFAGGFAALENGVASGLARLRTGKFQIDWDRFSIMAGQETPVFSLRSPTSLSSMAVPALSYFGNMWTWASQVRAEYRIPMAGNSKLLLQGGLLDPLAGEDPEEQGYLDPGAGQKTGTPGWQSRIGWQSSDARRGFGMGNYFSRQTWGEHADVNAWAITGDWQFPLGRRFEFSGEIYRGQALAGLGGGENKSIIVEALPGGAVSVFGLHSAGGWAQIKLLATPRLELNWAFGENVPYAADLRRDNAEAQHDERVVGRNSSSFINAIYKLRSNVVLSGEFRRLWTDFPGGGMAHANHASLSAGVLF